MKKRSQIKSWLLFCVLSNLVVFSQKNEMNSNFESKYMRAIELYNNNSYDGAQKIFNEVSLNSDKNSNLKTNADYYDAMCAIKLNQVNADKKVEAFVENNPYSTKKEKAFLEVGNFYFSNQKAAHALKWYSKINTKLLRPSYVKELNFKMAYAFLVSNYLKMAKEKFSTLLGDPIYGNDARYYYGYISYKQNNYGEAENNLSQLSNDATYKNKANYYLLDMAFKNGNFKKSVQIGKKILNTANKKQKSDIVKIIGESYFNLGNYGQAIPFLTKYKGKKGKWNNTDYYYLGYAYYKQKDYKNAINFFTKIINGNNKIAQNAYYHLAECYLKLNKKIEALNAFKNAGEMIFDKKIIEDAQLNYAKLSYEEGNPYKSVPDVLKEYLINYPKSKSKNEISQLLVTSYIHQRDYQGAIDYLSKNKSFVNDNLSNEVSLYRGIQLFNNHKLKSSTVYFNAAKKSLNDTISNKGKYWLAETNFILGDYKKALKNYLEVNSNIKISEAKNLNYNIAYTFFKLKDYQNALKYFNLFLKQDSDELDFKNDATNRLADSYFATKDYEKAIKTYYKTIKEGGEGSDYAQYQKALSYGLVGDKTKKIKDLQKVVNNYSNSKLKDDALFQLALTYTSLSDYNNAKKSYEKLLNNYPKSNYVPSVLLRQGLLFYKKGNNLKALSKFKKIVSNFPNSSQAKQAVANARNVYVDMGKVNEYLSWIKTLLFLNITNKEIDDTAYEAAENKFLDGNYKLSINGFKSYLKNYPNGLNVLKAHFYLANSFENNNQKEKSIPHYKYVISKEKNEYSEESLVKLSNFYLKAKRWKNVIILLDRIEKEANYQQNIFFAQRNLMKAFYKIGKYNKAIEYAKKLLANEKISQIIIEEAEITIARSAIKINDFNIAQEYYEIVDQTAMGEIKAESLYYKAFFLNEAKAYKDSNKEIQNLISNYSSYKYWGVKSYIVMAKNYFALKDAYQASYILENIIKNFKEFSDLQEEAKNELRTIKKNEAKTNESVNTQK